MKTIAYQGIPGSYSYLAAIKQFKDSSEHSIFLGFLNFREIFEKLDSGLADYAVIPIENSLIGSIHENYDLLNRFDVQIIGEYFLPINHCLLTVSNYGIDREERLAQIKKVFSHPKALEQCGKFLQRHPWIEAIACRDTGTAALDVASKQDLTCAAIACGSTGELHGLDLLEEGIEDDSTNTTRFFILSKSQVNNVEGNKGTIVMHLNHVPGALARCLTLIANQGVNLTKIESRPLEKKPFEYLFYLDFKFDEQKRSTIIPLLNELRSQVISLKELGFYHEYN